MREAVIQNRLVLDRLPSQQGGVCKMLGVSCCFHITDNSDNVTDIIDRAHEAIHPGAREGRLMVQLARHPFGWMRNLDFLHCYLLLH